MTTYSFIRGFEKIINSKKPNSEIPLDIILLYEKTPIQIIVILINCKVRINMIQHT